jgi:hypothetical protein
MQSATAPGNVTFSKPTVIPTDAGMVVRVNKENKAFGHIVLKHARLEFSENGFMDEKFVTCLVKGPIEVLSRMNWKPWQELPGKIVISESLTPFRDKSFEYDIKMSNREDGVILRVDDEPIFRRTYYSRSESREDVLIQHTNTDEVRAHIAARADVVREEIGADFDD